MLKSAATVFTVDNIGASIAYYRDALGFSIEFQYGDPPTYACLRRDNVTLHLVHAAISKRQAGQGGLCVFVDDVDALHAELAARGARIVKPPADYDYGMREFNASDLDGNSIIYGMASKPKAAP